jgi:5-methylthioadenosine/S-adenosylhomocysteine deaminase
MLLKNATYLAPTMRLDQADICIVDGRIAAIMPVTGARPDTAGAVVDCTGMFLLPGLINAHFHSQSNAGRGLFRNMGLHDWAGPGVQGQLQRRFFDFLDTGATDDELRTICLQAYVELLRQGVTFTQDSGLGERSAVLLMEAANTAGIRALIDAYDAIDALRDRVAGQVRFGGHLPEEEDITDATLAAAAQVRSAADLILMTHCLETPQRKAIVVQHYGRSTVQLFADHSLLDGRTVLFHGVELSDDDIRVLAARGASLVHCPISNLSAIAPLGKCLAHGVNVALGTDFGYADLWETMRVAFYLQKGRREIPPVDAETIWRMATINGARAYQLGDHLGAIAEGYAADLVFVDGADLALLPLVEREGFTNRVHNLLIWGRPHMVRHVMIAGEWVVQERQVMTVDEQALAARYQRIMQRIVSL